MSEQTEGNSYDQLLNDLISELKALTISINYFEKFESGRDESGLQVAKDSIQKRVENIEKLISGNHQMTFPGKEVTELFKDNLFEKKVLKKISSKEINAILSFPIESLRKFALSEILRSSLDS